MAVKYKFDLSPSIKSTVEWQLQYYPENKRQLESLKKELIPSAVQGYSMTAGVGGGEAKRTTEEITLNILSSPYLRRLELTCEAMDRAWKMFDETDRRLIDLVYWKREYTVGGAGMKIGLQKSAAYQRINKILGVIAYELGYVSL